MGHLQGVACSCDTRCRALPVRRRCKLWVDISLPRATSPPSQNNTSPLLLFALQVKFSDRMTKMEAKMYSIGNGTGAPASGFGWRSPVKGVLRCSTDWHRHAACSVCGMARINLTACIS